MNRQQPNGVAYYTFPSLAAFPEVVHGITTRHGGVSKEPFATLNLTTGTGDERTAVEENLERACAALGIRRADVVSPNQRHTANVLKVGRADRGKVLSNYDVLITDQPGVSLLLRYADCTPILIYDPTHHAVAVVHSGWRGTVLGAARAAVEAMAAQFDSRPSDLTAGIGPSIGPCCYEVGDDVLSAVRATFAGSAGLLPRHANRRYHFDLWGANRRLLAGAGVNRIEVSEMCTACRVDEFYSYRAEARRTGHFGAVMSLEEKRADD